MYIIKNKKRVKRCGLLAKKRAKKYFEQNLVTKKLLEFICLNIIKDGNKNF